MADEEPTELENGEEDLHGIDKPPKVTGNQSKSFFAASSSISESDEKRSFFFSYVADHPWPFLFIIPFAFALIIAFGWTKNDKVETSSERLWIEDDGSYAHDQNYAESLGMRHVGVTSFLAMATSRDGENILTATQLEEIRARMEHAEATTIDYKNTTYTWDDLCGNNPAPYQFPCLRLSPMDLFRESSWMFSEQNRVDYYQNVIKDFVIGPLLPRFGIMLEECTDACAFVLAYRRDPESIGYPANVSDPFGLLGDVATLEYNHPCRICIEDSYTTKIKAMHESIKEEFEALAEVVLKSKNALQDTTETGVKLTDIATKLSQLSSALTTDDVVEFYKYYVARGLMGELGADPYVEAYQLLAGEGMDMCELGVLVFGFTCPPKPSDVDAAMAKQHLLNQADNAFSSVCTSGAPVPFWSEADGTGVLFKANEETGTLLPTSGSGVNMSAPMTSLRSYMTSLFLAKNETADPDSQLWRDMVETNPYYSWFMANLTLAEEGTMCGNGNLTGTDTGIPSVDLLSAEGMANNTQRWCTKYDVPNPSDPGAGGYSKQHFARMWYDLLFTSEPFMNFVQGQDDPYTWTTGAGCGYVMGGERYSYTNQTVKDILRNASGLVYSIDEGATIGPIDRNLLIGGAFPAVGEYDFDNPLKEATVLQSIYTALVAEDLVYRVQNCHRPGGPVNITLEDAKTILYTWKEAMENSWNEGWDNETDGEVQFVSYFDDTGGAMGSTSRMLRDMTLSSDNLLIIGIVLIAVFSVLFLFSLDPVESRVLLTLMGVGLVVLSFYAGIGVALLIGIKINLAIAWTLPFVIIGLGVDDVYIVLLAIKKQGGYSKRHYLKAMKEVVVPVTMTSLVNASMFAVMSSSSIPAVYETAQTAIFCVIALYLSVVFCFPAYCYVDLRRQEAGRFDVLFCLKSSAPPAEGRKEDFRSIYFYDKFYKPIVLSSKKKVRYLSHLIIILISITVFIVGAWGMTQRGIGITPEQLFPTGTSLNRWSTLRTETMTSEPFSMNWGAIDYGDPDVQMNITKQFEDVVANPRVAEVDTKQLWIAQFAIWTSRHCGDNYARTEFDSLKCGRDQMFDDGSYCSGTWVPNKFGLSEKDFQDITDDTCRPNEGGICRPWNQMHPDDLNDIGLDAESAEGQVFCPVIKDWSDEKWKFCLKTWRNILGPAAAAHRFVLEDERGSPTECSGVYNQDEEFAWPIPYSSSPVLYSFGLYTHQMSLDLIEETRAVCDYNEDVHCWMSGVTFDYWQQYIGIFEMLWKNAGIAAAVGFGIAAIFLFARLSYERNHPTCQILTGSLLGAFLIAVTIIFTLVPVVGISCLAEVPLTAFSNMSFLFSIGFAVEYSVHIVSRWMRADMSHKTSLDRVDYTMSFLMIPTFMSFVSSTIGVICLAFTEFEFNRIFFFRPLIIVMFLSYWVGCWLLPVVLTYLDWDVFKLGKPSHGDALVSSKASTSEDVRANGSDEEDPNASTSSDPGPEDVSDEDGTKSS